MNDKDYNLEVIYMSECNGCVKSNRSVCCNECYELLEFLDSRGIKYTQRDALKEKGTWLQVAQKVESFPIVFINGSLPRLECNKSNLAKILSDFDAKKSLGEDKPN